MSFNVVLVESIHFETWFYFKIIKRLSIDIYAHDIIKCVLALSTSKRRFSRIIQEKPLSQAALIGLSS